MRTRNNDVEHFLAEYPPQVRAAAAGTRQLILATLPDIEETLDRPARIVGYGYGRRYSDLICTIIPSKTGVKLGIARGADLPDPEGLLTGSGKRHRHVEVGAGAKATKPALKRLLRTALAAWKQQQDAAG
jgi:hypothetical protein